MEDTATRWVELFALRQATADACAWPLVNDVFLRFGISRRLYSDNGTQLISSLMQQVTHCLGIDQTFTAVYHPAANPVERKNRDLKTQLAIQVKTDHSSWAEYLLAIRFAMNTTKCQTTGYSAAYLVFGQELRTAYDVGRDIRTILSSDAVLPEITSKLERLADTLLDARETHEKEQERRKDQADKHRRRSPEFAPGTKVWVKTHLLSSGPSTRTQKFLPKRDGPYVILAARGPSRFEVATRALQNPNEPVGVYHSGDLQTMDPLLADAPPVQPLRRRGRPRKGPALADPRQLIQDHASGRADGPEGGSVAPLATNKAQTTR